MVLINDFISAMDRIVSASIDIISDAGLDSLTVKNISMRTNISEVMIYKYFTNTDEILKEVVSTYFKFDKSIFKTIDSREDTYTNKLWMYVDAYSSYYDSYYALSSIMLQYEELLHNTNTRELVENGYLERRMGLTKLFKGALDNHEISMDYAPEEMTDFLLGMFMMCSLNRRVMPRKKSYKDEIKHLFGKWMNDMTYKDNNEKSEV